MLKLIKLAKMVGDHTYSILIMLTLSGAPGDCID